MISIHSGVTNPVLRELQSSRIHGKCPNADQAADLTSLTNTQIETWQKIKGKRRSQLRVHLSSTLWQLVHVEVKVDITLQAEEAAVARLLKDGLCFEFSRLAEKHQQVPIQKPGSTEGQSL